MVLVSAERQGGNLVPLIIVRLALVLCRAHCVRCSLEQHETMPGTSVWREGRGG